MTSKFAMNAALSAAVALGCAVTAGAEVAHAIASEARGPQATVGRASLAGVRPPRADTSSAAPGIAASPAELKIAAVRKAIDKEGDNYLAWSELAMAFARRARETSDVSFYAQASDSVERSLALKPDNAEALKTRAWIWLGQHRFADARELATSLNRRIPDDVMVYGILTDANVELGRYAEAEKAAQWMLDLRQTVPGLTRAAYLRELFGDVEGALELMQMALAQTPDNETEDRAWLLTQIAHLQLLQHDAAGAERTLVEALATFPDYHYALAGLAKVRMRQGRAGEAADLLSARYDAAPHPEDLFDLAVALERCGRRADAKVAFARFEAAARQEVEKNDNANHELVLYYADHANRPGEALRIARLELARRGDVYTRDAYAWALFKTGHRAEARREMSQVLAVGVVDPRVLEHARAIGLTGQRSAKPPVVARNGQ